MAAASGVTLANNISALGFTSAVRWSGGRAALVLNATVFPTTTNLQLQHIDGTWINVNTTNLTTAGNQVTPFDLPPGQYRMSFATGTVTAAYASLVSITYAG